MDVENNSIPHVDPFRQLLQSVASDVTNENLFAMKFLCESHIPKGRLEKLIRPLELFSVLIEQDLIGDNHCDFLVFIFDEIGRQDLSRRILNKEGSTARSRSSSAVCSEVNRNARNKDKEVNRDAGTKENEVNRDDGTKENEVNRDADTKENEVNRDAGTKENVVNRDAGTKENEVNRDADTKENEVNRDADTKENVVNRDADTKENEVNRDADTKENEVNRDAGTKENVVNIDADTKENEVNESAVEDNVKVMRDRRIEETLSTKIVFAYSTTSSELLQGIPETALRRRVTEGVLFGRGKGIEKRGVFLNDETASRRHVELEAITDGGNSQIEFFLHVHGKPIQVNGKSIKSGQRIKLKNNCDLKMGQLQFKVFIFPGVNLDTYQLEFARLSDLQSINGRLSYGNLMPGQGTAFPVNYYPFAQVPGYIPLPNLIPNQGPQVFHPQACERNLPGDANVSYPYPATPNFSHGIPCQSQGQPVLPQSQFNGTSTYPQGSDLISSVSVQQEDQTNYEKTAAEKRKVFRDQKKEPSEHAEEEQSEEVQEVSRSIEETHPPKCEE